MPEEEHFTLNDELIYALYHDENADCIRALLAAGADANADDGYSTALHLAVEQNAPDIVQLLIESGARLNPLNEHGWTPLRCAADESRVECVRLLLEAGADPRQATTDGDTAYTFAEDSDNTLALNLFREYTRHA